MKHLIVALALLFPAITMAGDVVTVYTGDSPSGELNATSSADIADLTSSDYSSRVQAANHHQIVTVSAAFSAASATAAVGIVRGELRGGTFYPYNSASCDWTTLTADDTYKVNGRYISKSTAFDTANCDAFFIFVKSISSGTVLVGWRVH